MYKKSQCKTEKIKKTVMMMMMMMMITVIILLINVEIKFD